MGHTGYIRGFAGAELEAKVKGYEGKSLTASIPSSPDQDNTMEVLYVGS